MFRFTPRVAGGSAIGVATVAAMIFTVVTAPHSVDRSAKVDRMPASTSVQSGGKRIAVVEVVGLHDAAIVYRDREGRVLFSTDPVANMTVVTKNLALPEVTVRETTESQVERVPVENMGVPNSDMQSPPQGCESGLSPDISPTFPITKDRCVVEIKPITGVASLQ